MTIALSILALIALGYIGFPLTVWAAAFIVLAIINWCWPLAVIGVVLGIFSIRPIRMQILTRPIFTFIRKKGLVPKVSETEEVALRAGTNWIETDLFSGKPDFEKIFKEPYPDLTIEEKAFMDNQVETLCGMVTDWEIFANRDLPENVWEYMKKEKFFGMIIPKEYGGLGFSALGHSSVVHKLATRSQVLAITTMVPNSLGPGELLNHYGTKEQKDHYLPRLADGRDLPCFGLTEPTAGSDAASITSHGVVFKDDNGEVKVRLNFKKRYITLGAVATVIGLAFRLKDPENLLNKGTEAGITCALVPHNLPGVKLGRRHDPMGVPFVNSPINGENVVIGLEHIIGGIDGVGKGWKMLMECLAVGRGISLPSTSAGGAKLVSRVVASYSSVRKQFGMSIGKFEAIEEPIARIAGFTYLLEAMRKFVAGAVNRGAKPAVTNAIAKYHSTEKFREVINDGMDILAGAAIIRGPRNLLAHAYYGTPVGITVEGANIMTRGLIQFGQGAVRCHPYSYNEMKALMDGNLDAFDRNFWAHVGHLVRNKCRMVLLCATRGHLHRASGKGLRAKYERKLAWSSAKFAFMTDVALALYGASVKRRETINGRFGDILSYMLMAVCILKRYEAEGCRKDDKLAADWALKYCMYKIQIGFVGLYENMGFVFKYLFAPFARLNPIGLYPSDRLGQKLAANLLDNEAFKENLSYETYIPKSIDEHLKRLEEAAKAAKEAEQVTAKIKAAMKSGKLPKGKPEKMVEEASTAGVITAEEAHFMKKSAELWIDAIMVDSFEIDDYLSYKMERSV